MQPVPGVLVARATTEFPNRVNVSWDPVAGANGYMVARKLPGQDAQMLTASPITQTSLRDSLVNEGQVKYQVYACSIRTSASGSYYDMGKPAEATVLTTDVAEFVQPLHATVSVSPQPATTAATLNLSSDTEIVTMVMTISDLNGVTIHSESVGSRSAGNHQVALPVELLASGHYIVTLHTPGGMFTAPLVVVH
jgi:fibronectin type 3 domain-containing protein